MMLLLSSKLLTKHIMSSLYYRMFVFYVIYFLLIKLHSLNTEVFCMQENAGGNQPDWKTLYEESQNRINLLENLVRQHDINATYFVEKYENLEQSHGDWQTLAVQRKKDMDLLEIEIRQLKEQNQQLQGQVESLSKRTTEFENIQRAFSNPRK